MEEEIRLIKELKKDYERNEKKYPQIIILSLYRLGNFIYYSNIHKIIRCILLLILKIPYTIIKIIHNIEIPFGCKIGGGLRIRHPQGIIINPHTIIGENCTIFHDVTIGTSEFTGVDIAANIGDNVYIGCGAKIIGNINVSDNVKIGANAVVVKGVPKGSVVICNQITIEPELL